MRRARRAAPAGAPLGPLGLSYSDLSCVAMLYTTLTFGTFQLANHKINDGRVHFQIVWRDPCQRQIDFYAQSRPFCCCKSWNTPVTTYAWRT
jgi:hypothetical protein